MHPVVTCFLLDRELIACATDRLGLGHCLGRRFYTSVTSMGGPDIVNNQGAGASSGGKVINIIAVFFCVCVLRDIGIQIKNIFSFFIYFLFSYIALSGCARGAGEFLYERVFFYFRKGVYLRGAPGGEFFT